MKCPKCAHLDDKVIDTRSVRGGLGIRRRRVCLQCSNRFTTYEEIVKANLKVFKRDGRHEDLSRQKLVDGITVACQKRPISTRDIESIVDSIMNEVEAEFEREVPSTLIGRKVMEKLEEVDQVAFVRFASVYRRFRDATQFLNEVEGLKPLKAKS